MNDRELLELAAKAAGYEFDGNLVRHRYSTVVWDPLNDDGDALRLAVTLGLDLKLRQYLPKAFDLIPGADIPDQADAFESVRRAIVQAAAEVGRLK